MLRVGGGQQTPAARMRGRVELPGGERRSLRSLFQPVVVAVGAAALDQGNPPEHCSVGRRVVHAARPRARKHVDERLLERLALPLAEAGTDALDETARVAFLARVD